MPLISGPLFDSAVHRCFHSRLFRNYLFNLVSLEELAHGSKITLPLVCYCRRPVIDPAAWTGKALEADTSWIIELDHGALDDLKYLADQLRPKIEGNPGALLNFTRDDMPIGRFTGVLDRVRHMLVDGVGVTVLRGLPVTEWDRLDLMIAYWAMGRHLGRALSNNGEGDMIGHVLDAGKEWDKPNHRGYQTNVTMDYHVDQCDVVCLLCLQTARFGGKSKLASSIAVYNEMLVRRPDLVTVLSTTLLLDTPWRDRPRSTVLVYISHPKFFGGLSLCVLWSKTH